MYPPGPTLESGKNLYATGISIWDLPFNSISDEEDVEYIRKGGQSVNDATTASNFIPTFGNGCH